ncbi:MAG: hypothetical protein JW891_00400 [Candidatus Lokiarchaeota archaeon]|nr:hypothetical protein [Candidatus Lokiarchaeota archaeon]
MNIEEINEKIKNPPSNLKTLKGYEIIAESIVEKVRDLFGRNSLLTMLYQVGAGPGKKISERLKSKYGKEDFDIIEALEILTLELKEFYSIIIKDITEDEEKIRIIIQNHCFLRDSFKEREKLQYGKAFCRINKGYYEVALKNLIGEKIRKVEINFLENSEEQDACVEEMLFYK